MDNDKIIYKDSYKIVGLAMARGQTYLIKNPQSFAPEIGNPRKFCLNPGLPCPNSSTALSMPQTQPMKMQNNIAPSGGKISNQRKIITSKKLLPAKIPMLVNAGTAPLESAEGIPRKKIKAPINQKI